MICRLCYNLKPCLNLVRECVSSIILNIWINVSMWGIPLKANTIVLIKDQRRPLQQSKESPMELGKLVVLRHKAKLQPAPGKSRQGGTPQGFPQLQWHSCAPSELAMSMDVFLGRQTRMRGKEVAEPVGPFGALIFVFAF